MKAQFARLRDKAKQRKIEFTITFAEFESCVGTDYHLQTGHFAHCLTIDRIKNELGYIPGNIQPLTKSENSIKRMKQDQIRHEKGYAWKTK